MGSSGLLSYASDFRHFSWKQFAVAYPCEAAFACEAVAVYHREVVEYHQFIIVKQSIIAFFTEFIIVQLYTTTTFRPQCSDLQLSYRAGHSIELQLKAGLGYLQVQSVRSDQQLQFLRTVCYNRARARAGSELQLRAARSDLHLQSKSSQHFSYSAERTRSSQAQVRTEQVEEQV